MWRIRPRLEEVADVLVVDFKIRHADIVADIGALIGLDSLEQIFAGPRDQAGLVRRTHHGVTLARPGLAVGEDARMVAFKVVVQKLFAQAVEDIFLVRVVTAGGIVGPEGIVEGENLLFEDFSRLGASVGRIRGRRHEEFGGLGIGVHLNEALGAAVQLWKYELIFFLVSSELLISALPPVLREKSLTSLKEASDPDNDLDVAAAGVGRGRSRHRDHNRLS